MLCEACDALKTRKKSQKYHYDDNCLKRIPVLKNEDRLNFFLKVLCKACQTEKRAKFVFDFFFFFCGWVGLREQGLTEMNSTSLAYTWRIRKQTENESPKP